MQHGLIIFDLDGVLIDSKEIHYQALNMALEQVSEEFIISREQHASTFDGLSTKVKLDMLAKERGLPEDRFQEIWDAKQKFTLQLLDGISRDSQLIEFFLDIKKREIPIAIASNSVRKTIEVILERLGVESYVDLVLSNEDVKTPKPHPEIYWKCMIEFQTHPSLTVIFEDSHIGRQAALNSGALLIPVASRSDITWSNIEFARNYVLRKSEMNKPWKSKTLNVLIPMAGAGSRFESAGYTFPKPLIEVKGKPMIQVVVENLNIEANYIFIVQKAHYEKFRLDYLLPLIAPGCTIIQAEGVTDGAARTTLLAKQYIDNEQPLLIANSDQFIEWNSSETMYFFESSNIDGGIVTFESTHPKWSFVKLADNGLVEEVAEKKPISNLATVGIYYWKKGSEYVKSAQQMIEKDVRTNGEFYVCPAFNEAILNGLKVRTKNVSGMWGIGTPEDLEVFLTKYTGNVY